MGELQIPFLIIIMSTVNLVLRAFLTYIEGSSA